MKTKLLAMMILAGGGLFSQTAFGQVRFSVGVNAGGFGAAYNQDARAYASNTPPCPGPGYTWVDGYQSRFDGRNAWVAGFWQAPVRNYQFESRFNNNDDRRFNDRRFDDRDDRRFSGRRINDNDDRRFNDRDDRRFNDRDDRRFTDRDDRRFNDREQRDNGDRGFFSGARGR